MSHGVEIMYRFVEDLRIILKDCFIFIRFENELKPAG